MKPFLCLSWFALLLFVSAVSLSAQEVDLYKGLVKESIDMSIIDELKKMEGNLNPFTNPIELDANKRYLPRLGYNYELNALFNDNPFEVKDGHFSISSNVTAWYTNVESFDRTSTDSAVDIIANGILTPLGALGTFNIIALAYYLMDIGVLPNEPFVPKEEKKHKRLREIKSIYNID